MNTTSRLWVVLTALALSVWSIDAFACECDKSVKPVKGSKMVFWGKVLDIKPRGAQDRVEFEINELYKGDERDAISVYSNRFHHDCGIRFEVGKTYMVYGYDFYPRGVATSMCWGSYEAEEPVAEDKWKDVEVKLPEDTELEEQLREIGKPLVTKCGRQHRVFDGGFGMIMSTDGDPVPPPIKRTKDKRQEFRDCVFHGFMEQDELPRPDRAVTIDGWYQREVKSIPVLLDQLPCGEDCPDWTNRVKALLTRIQQPEPKDKESFNLRAETEQCLAGGISAVGGESHGAPSFRSRRDRVLTDCALQRGEFEFVGPYLEQIDNKTITTAIEWAADVAEIEIAKKPAGGDADADAGADGDGGGEAIVGAGSKGEGRAAKVFPLSKPGQWTFHERAIEIDDDDDGPGPGQFRVLRSQILMDPHWSENPVYLEAFAQSILADSATTDGMRALAAMAFHRAGKLVPGAADRYEKLAAEASGSKAAVAMRNEFNKAWDEVHAPKEEPTPEIDVAEQVPEVEPQEEKQQDPMLLVIAGVLIVVALLGIGAILKKRAG